MDFDRCRRSLCHGVRGWLLLAVCVQFAGGAEPSEPIPGVFEYRADDVQSAVDSSPWPLFASPTEDIYVTPATDPQSLRIAQLEYELATIKQRLDGETNVQLASANMGDGSCDCGCGEGGVCTCGSSCGCCSSCGGTPCAGPYCDHGGPYAGFSFVFARPHYKESFQAAQTNLVPPGQMNLIPFEFDYELAPRVWFGCLGSEGRGMQVSYWHFDHDGGSLTRVADATNFYSAQTVTVVIPAAIATTAPGDVLNVSNSLKFETIDLEGVQQYYLGDSQFLLSGGLRFASIDQNYLAIVSGAVPQSLRTFRTFEGVGPTVGALGSVPSGLWQTLRFFGQFRAALLFGDKTLGRELTPAGPLPGTAAPDIGGVLLDDAREVFGGGGVELGVKWAYPTQWGDWFCQTSYGGELWTEAGAPTLTFLGFETFSVSLGLTR